MELEKDNVADDGYRLKRSRSLWLSDLQEVVGLMDSVEKALGTKATVRDATIIAARDDGEPLAEIWWDGESESWLCDWLTGSGA